MLDYNGTVDFFWLCILVDKFKSVKKISKIQSNFYDNKNSLLKLS